MFDFIVQIINTLWKNILEQQLAVYILGALGLGAGGIYLWIAKFGLNWAWTKKINPVLKSDAAYGDEKIIEDGNVKKLDGAIKDGTLDEIGKSAGDLLNGRKP